MDLYNSYGMLAEKEPPDRGKFAPYNGDLERAPSLPTMATCGTESKKRKAIRARTFSEIDTTSTDTIDEIWENVANKAKGKRSKLKDYGINNILYQRGIYSPDSFAYKQQYGLTVFESTEKNVKDYLGDITTQIKGWLEEGRIQRLVLVISQVDTKETLERWEFKIHTDKEFTVVKDTDAAPKTAKKELKEIQKEMQDVMRQITASVTFLPLLDCVCSFNILVYTHKDITVPVKWGDSSACLIDNAEEVKLKSFSTSIQKVDTCVTYKVAC